MSTHKTERLESAIQRTAAEFVNRESNRNSLITVTKVELQDRSTSAIVFVSVFPPEQTGAVIDFLKRQREDFAEYFKKNVKYHSVPRITFQADPEMGVDVTQSP